MKHRKGPQRPEQRSPADRAIESAPAFPAWKAFVVQFSRETGTETKIFAGRVEHLNSGQRFRFDSPAELLATLTKLLNEIVRPAANT